MKIIHIVMGISTVMVETLVPRNYVKLPTNGSNISDLSNFIFFSDF